MLPLCSLTFYEEMDLKSEFLIIAAKSAIAKLSEHNANLLKDVISNPNNQPLTTTTPNNTTNNNNNQIIWATNRRGEGYFGQTKAELEANTQTKAIIMQSKIQIRDNYNM